MGVFGRGFRRDLDGSVFGSVVGSTIVHNRTGRVHIGVSCRCRVSVRSVLEPELFNRGERPASTASVGGVWRSVAARDGVGVDPARGVASVLAGSVSVADRQRPPIRIQ